MAGHVFVNEQKADKAGIKVDPDSCFAIKGKEHPYVSRGGVKLEHALEFFHVPVEGKVAVDIGASTGGFTHCLLLRGAAKVYAVDVGYGQLDWSLRNDPRVICMEKTNIRYLESSRILEPVSLAVIDASFISLKKIFEPVLALLTGQGEALALIKPQFEVAAHEVGKGGIVKDPVLHARVVQEMVSFAQGLGVGVAGTVESPIKGPKGNKEFFIYVKK
jgi:23S rRNA (cytidine1920-2'-O)/16S rRNA (cytidine1409-2'-O)-methyltransferase